MDEQISGSEDVAMTDSPSIPLAWFDPDEVASLTDWLQDDDDA